MKLPDRGLDKSNYGRVLTRQAGTTGWALCVGAGISKGAFPQWRDLVKSLIRRDGSVSRPNSLLRKLSASFAYDALIQASKDRLRLDDEAFVDLLSDLLYERLRKKARGKWGLVATALTAASPGPLTQGEWVEFLALIQKLFPKLSALRIAEAIAPVMGGPKAPTAILSFNAEPMLYALIHANVAAGAHPGGRLKDLRILDRLTRGISFRRPGHVPYIFCHGLLPIDGGIPTFAKTVARGNLVFSEGDYLRLANSAFSWQSALFLGTAVMRSTVFIGLSFSDPNLRRWLAWIHASKRRELTNKRKGGEPYGHYWIRPKETDPIFNRWIEASVRHLGVRLVWLEDWAELGPCLHAMLSGS